MNEYHKIVLSVSGYRIVIRVTETATCGIIVFGSDKMHSEVLCFSCSAYEVLEV